MQDNTAFTELLITKIFHDMAGPVTAISNGMEFITDFQDKELTHKAHHLVSIASGELAHKINLFRFMYGKTSLDGEMDLQDIKKIMNEYFEFTKIHINWPKYSSEDSVINLTSLSSRLLVNLLYLAASTLIGGGEITVELQKIFHGKRIHIIANGQRLKIFNCILKILKEKKLDEINLENVQIHLIFKLANALGVLINIDYDEHTLNLSVDIV